LSNSQAQRHLNEIGAFVPIFGIPTALAWYLAYWVWR
jgi:hypothetical protein